MSKTWTHKLQTDKLNKTLKFRELFSFFINKILSVLKEADFYLNFAWISHTKIIAYFLGRIGIFNFALTTP